MGAASGERLGLLIPQTIPDVSGDLDRWRTLPYGALALEVLRRFVSDIPEKDLESLVGRTYTREAFVPDPAPSVEVGPLEGALRIINKGVSEGDRVIVSGLQRAVPGQKVDPQTAAPADKK